MNNATGAPRGEDIELGIRISVTGHRIILDPRIRAKHLKRWTLLSLLKTDIFDRGIPWTRSMLRARAVGSTLNVTPIQRLSVGLVYLTSFALLTAARWPTMLITAATLALIVTLLNLDLYRFYLKRRGLWFALRVVPMHWVYFLCCGLSVVGGTLLHLLERDRTKLPSIPAGERRPCRSADGFLTANESSPYAPPRR